MLILIPNFKDKEIIKDFHYIHKNIEIKIRYSLKLNDNKIECDESDNVNIKYAYFNDNIDDWANEFYNLKPPKPIEILK